MVDRKGYKFVLGELRVWTPGVVYAVPHKIKSCGGEKDSKLDLRCGIFKLFSPQAWEGIVEKYPQHPGGSHCGSSG